MELDSQGKPNPQYRAEKLKSILEKDGGIGKNVSFTKVSLKDHGSLSMWLVYSANTNLPHVVAEAYLLGTADLLKDSAIYLRQVILKAFKESTELPWPPTADELEKRAEEELPDKLKQFLNQVLSGSGPEVETYDRTCRLVYSIG